MGRPAGWKPYTLEDGTKVPSVTTICGRFKESGALMYWCWDQGRQGKDFRETKDAAAEAGTLAHAAVEAFIRGKAFDWPTDSEIVDKARRAFGAFKEWADQSRLVVTEPETRLVSEKYRFGGTLDAMMLSDKRALGDWKSSSGVYADYLLQIAAYGILWDENHPDEPVTGGFHLCRFDKVYGDFSHHWWSELETAKRQFLLLREAYDCDAELKARIK